MEMTKPTTKEEARSNAIEWQHWVSEQNLSYGELAEWQAHWTQVAEDFNLTNEFCENGII